MITDKKFYVLRRRENNDYIVLDAVFIGSEKLAYKEADILNKIEPNTYIVITDLI